MTTVQCLHRTTAAVAVVVSALASLAAQPGGGAKIRAEDPPDANLLWYANGTIVRSYTPGIKDVYAFATGGAEHGSAPKGPLQLVYELSGVATLSRMSVTFDRTEAGQTPWTATLAVSSTSATAGFRDLGVVHSTEDGEPQSVPGASGVRARWIKVTAVVPETDPPLQQILAEGTLAPRPASAPAVVGDFWSFEHDINAAGGVSAKPSDNSPDRLEVTQIDAGINGVLCSERGFAMGLPGHLDGRTWTYVADGSSDVHGRLVLNDEGTLLVGADDSAGVRTFERTKGGELPDFCTVRALSTGPKHALVLNSPHWDFAYPFRDQDDLAEFSGWQFSVAPASLVTPAVLRGVDVAVLNGLCRPQRLLTAEQGAVLTEWVAAGHKLLIEDADECGGDPDHPTVYDFLPYHFLSDNPGARGAKGTELHVIENDTLGTADSSDPKRFIDTDAYLKDTGNDLGDANTVVSQDPHWCGHLFGTNADLASGFMQMYAVYGQGLIIFDGLDHDDAGVAAYKRLRRLEYEQPVPTSLACTRPVKSGFVIISDQTVTFVPGKAQTFTVPFQVIANRDWKGHVALSAAGDFHASVAAPAVELPPGEVAISLSVDVPATTKAGEYEVVVTGTGDGQVAQATLTLKSADTADILRATLDRGCKVPVYGVNFDFNRTTLRPDATPALEQVLALLTSEPTLQAEIGGHTDNIGTTAYNLTLSSGRADVVKAWLVSRGIEASRLTTHGYGDSAPLVPNDTDANRAKNRRVELKKPNCGGA